jgi:hypothetical protein
MTTITLVIKLLQSFLSFNFKNNTLYQIIEFYKTSLNFIFYIIYIYIYILYFILNIFQSASCNHKYNIENLDAFFIMYFSSAMSNFFVHVLFIFSVTHRHRNVQTRMHTVTILMKEGRQELRINLVARD